MIFKLYGALADIFINQVYLNIIHREQQHAFLKFNF